MKKICYIDMDNVVVDFQSGIDRLEAGLQEKHKDALDEVPHIFSLMAPLPGAIESLNKLSGQYELYLLSTAPWNNPTAWIHKVEWVHRHFGKGPESLFYKRLIISHHKNLNRGDYLIDDRPNNGAKEFAGEWIHFGSERFPAWDDVCGYLLN